MYRADTHLITSTMHVCNMLWSNYRHNDHHHWRETKTFSFCPWEALKSVCIAYFYFEQHFNVPHSFTNDFTDQIILRIFSFFFKNALGWRCQMPMWMYFVMDGWCNAYHFENFVLRSKTIMHLFFYLSGQAKIMKMKRNVTWLQYRAGVLRVHYRKCSCLVLR